jgi:hypothetical protein
VYNQRPVLDDNKTCHHFLCNEWDAALVFMRGLTSRVMAIFGSNVTTYVTTSNIRNSQLASKLIVLVCSNIMLICTTCRVFVRIESCRFEEIYVDLFTTRSPKNE